MNVFRITHICNNLGLVVYRGFLLDATSVFLVCRELLELMEVGTLEPEVAFLNASLIPDVFPILLDASSRMFIAKSRDLAFLTAQLKSSLLILVLQLMRAFLTAQLISSLLILVLQVISILFDSTRAFLTAQLKSLLLIFVLQLMR
ncbi:hypothetical protein ACS0TY_014173 [Phlomoides rotata]